MMSVSGRAAGRESPPASHGGEINYEARADNRRTRGSRAVMVSARTVWGEVQLLP